MCFSAEASFTAAAELGGVGLLTCKATKTKAHLLLSIIPFIFALQQFSEGMLWLTFKVGAADRYLVAVSKHLYLFFVFILWPLWLPLSLAVAEQIQWRKRTLWAILFCGLLLTSYFFSNIPNNEITIKIVNRSLQYGMIKPFALDHWILIGMYTLVLVVPLFVSSMNMIWGLGILSLMTWFISECFYHNNFVSTWCFFSAILSIYFFFVIRANSFLEQTE